MNSQFVDQKNCTSQKAAKDLRIAIVCYHHFDASISLGRYLPKNDSRIKVDFFFLLCRSKDINVEIVDLRGHTFKNGLIPKMTFREALGDHVFDYLGEDVGVSAFIFNSLRLADPKNYRLLNNLRTILADETYDLIHFVGTNPWIVFLNAISRGVAKVHTIHEPYPFITLSKYRLFRYTLAIKILLRTKSQIIVPSDKSFKRLRKRYNTKSKKISVIPFGILEVYKSYLDKKVVKEDNLLVYYGTISKYKGVPDLLQAMVKVLEKNPNLKLVVAGAGDINYPIDQLPDNITITNRYLSNPEIAELNERASIIVCPYTSASQSGVVMTSFAFGNPVICTDVGAFSEVVRHKVNGLLVEPGNIKELTRIILEAFESPGLLQELRLNVVNANKDSSRSWQSITKRHIHLYKGLLTT